MFNGANTAFMLLCAALVLLMTPGLAFFYGGLVGRKSTLTIMVQSFASMGITTILWWVIGYSLCFSGGGDKIYGADRVTFRAYLVFLYTFGAWPSSAAAK
jgi:Amt family ammonium transporter